MSSKIPKHTSKDTDSYEELCGIIVEVSAKPLFKKFHHFSVLFYRHSWTIALVFICKILH
jgi:hypothetical protein